MKNYESRSSHLRLRINAHDFDECPSTSSVSCEYDGIREAAWQRPDVFSELILVGNPLTNCHAFFFNRIVLLNFLILSNRNFQGCIAVCLSKCSGDLSPYGEGEIWTLAPLLTTCTLSRGVPSATWVLLQIAWINAVLPKYIWSYQMSGEDGIRTHVALPPNGFQDRLVMTTSIPLQKPITEYLWHYLRAAPEWRD